MVAEKLGLGQAYTEGKSEQDWLREWVTGATQADPAFPGFEEFKRQGVFVTHYPEPAIALGAFRADPVANPLATPSGKIELFSTVMWNAGDPEEIPAIPKYIPEWEGPSDPLTAKYPLQLISHHYHRRAHSTYDNIDWLDEVMPQRVFMNPLDADARGIKQGDQVRIFNDRGVVIIPVRVTPRILPGVVSIPQGAWWTPDADGIDRRGCVNTLTSQRPTPMAKGTAQLTGLVQVEKA
jgi:anaerobic dimethyl sulfoxide reductase subunit A